jgi:hypothetical protein
LVLVEQAVVAMVVALVAPVPVLIMQPAPGGVRLMVPFKVVVVAVVILVQLVVVVDLMSLALPVLVVLSRLRL